MEYIITFKNTNFAIKAEQCLLEHKLHVSVLPLPSQIGAGCGICLRISPDEIDAALAALTDIPTDEMGMFMRERENGKYTYKTIKNTRCE